MTNDTDIDVPLCDLCLECGNREFAEWEAYSPNTIPKILSLCQSCASTSTAVCDSCDELFMEDTVTEVNSGGQVRCLCPTCVNEYPTFKEKLSLNTQRIREATADALDSILIAAKIKKKTSSPFERGRTVWAWK